MREFHNSLSSVYGWLRPLGGIAQWERVEQFFEKKNWVEKKTSSHFLKLSICAIWLHTFSFPLFSSAHLVFITVSYVYNGYLITQNIYNAFSQDWEWKHGREIPFHCQIFLFFRLSFRYGKSKREFLFSVRSNGSPDDDDDNNQLSISPSARCSLLTITLSTISQMREHSRHGHWTISSIFTVCFELPE